MYKLTVNLVFLVLVTFMPVSFADRIAVEPQREYGITAEEKGISYRGNGRMWPDYSSQSRPFRGGLGYPRKAYPDDAEAVREHREIPRICHVTGELGRNQDHSPS